LPSTIAELDPHVIGGVDTHKDFHVAVVINMIGHVQGTARFDTTPDGYAGLLAWMTGHGPVAKIGVEGTGAYGAGLARHLSAAGVDVVEINCPDRQTRRRRGKSDPTDAEAAARTVLSGEASLTPKDSSSTTEAVRALRVVRRSVMHNRTQAANQIHNLVLTAPADLRAELENSSIARLAEAVMGLDEPAEIVCARTGTVIALRHLARRWQALTLEIKQLDKTLTNLIARIAPTSLLAMQGVGTDVAGALLVAIGSNPERVHTEAGLAALCGVSPVENSSGRRQGSHRLNRGGNRDANNALWRIVMVRMVHDPRTRAYVERRTQQGKSKKAIMRCLKRYVTREVFNSIKRTPSLT
jgi:transposase